MNIIKNRYFYFLVSLLVIIPGIVFMILNWANIKAPLPLGIDFTGGSLLEVQFSGARPSTDTVNNVFVGIAPDTAPSIQPLGENSYSIRSKRIDDATKGQIVTALGKQTETTVTVLTFSSVSASVGAEVTRAAGIAIFMAALAMLAYISYAFPRVEHVFRYGAAAVIPMLNYVFVVLGGEWILALFLLLEDDVFFLPAF